MNTKCYCFPYLCLQGLGSGNTSLAGAKLSIIICLAYCLVALKLLSVPWNLSKTPKTPKQLLNLKQFDFVKQKPKSYNKYLL